MRNISKVVPARIWLSRLGSRTCPYENRLLLARWFFYYRLGVALDFLNPGEEGAVLDIGCWEGHSLPSLAANFSSVFAVDNDSASLVERLDRKWSILQLARELCEVEGCRMSRLSFVKADACSLPFPARSFNGVLCLDTLPFVAEATRDTFLGEIARVLDPEGTAVFSLPVEIGPAFALREIMRWISGTWIDYQGILERLPPLFGFPRRYDSEEKPKNLAGYDYRLDLKAVARRFAILKTEYVPCNILPFLSPTVVIQCRL